MSNLSDEQISIYEEPVNERVRKFIKIESYFDKMIYFKNKRISMIVIQRFIHYVNYMNYLAGLI